MKRAHDPMNDFSGKTRKVVLGVNSVYKRRSGVTPGGRRYVAEVKDKGRIKVTTVDKPGTKQEYRKVTITHHPANSGNTARYGKTDRYKMIDSHCSTNGNLGPTRKDIEKGPTTAVKSRKKTYADPVAKNARSKMRNMERNLKAIRSARSR